MPNGYKIAPHSHPTDEHVTLRHSAEEHVLRPIEERVYMMCEVDESTCVARRFSVTSSAAEQCAHAAERIPYHTTFARASWPAPLTRDPYAW